MSVVRRLVSGSVASWVKILVSVVTQIALVPLYLSHWPASVYGVWLAVMTLVELLQIIIKGHLQYIGTEFLIIGPERPAQLGRILSASLPYSFAICLLQIGITLALIDINIFHMLFGSGDTFPQNTITDANTILLLEIIVYGIFGGIGGIFVRALAPLGFYARTVWWGVVGGIVTGLAPAILVLLGGGILEAGLALVGAYVVYNLFAFYDIFRVLRRAGLTILQTPNFLLGAKNIWRSQVLVLTALLELLRSTGVRLVLAPLSGAVNLAAFATMRTGANVAHQGLGTITGPLMPELMRVLGQRDQKRSEAALATVWLVLVTLMAPGVVILQAFVEPLFVVWTRSQIDFDPMLFGVLSLGVLIFALAQPAMAIVKGNNLLRPQLLVAVLAAVIVVGGMIVLVPILGILGAGVALLGAELLSAEVFRIVAKRWLVKNRMEWPRSTASSAAMSVWIATVAIAGLVMLPSMIWDVLVVALVLLGVNMVIYWRSLPSLSKAHVKSILGKLFPRKRIT